MFLSVKIILLNSKEQVISEVCSHDAKPCPRQGLHIKWIISVSILTERYWKYKNMQHRMAWNGCHTVSSGQNQDIEEKVVSYRMKILDRGCEPASPPPSPHACMHTRTHSLCIASNIRCTFFYMVNDWGVLNFRSYWPVGKLCRVA
jgi:hypothetical protein